MMMTKSLSPGSLCVWIKCLSWGSCIALTVIFIWCKTKVYWHEVTYHTTFGCFKWKKKCKTHANDLSFVFSWELHLHIYSGMASITPTYNASFPSLHQTGLISQRRASAHHHPTTPSFIQRSIAPPRFPSYLKQTLYAKLALEQYRFYQQKHEIKPLPSNASKKSTTTCLEEEQLEELDLRLPTLWNSRDKSKNIEIGSNGIDLSYIGKRLLCWMSVICIN